VTELQSRSMASWQLGILGKVTIQQQYRIYLFQPQLGT